MDLKKISKRMSYLLRHDPAQAGLTMNVGGWVWVSELLAALKIDIATLETIVADNNKQRFELSADKSSIRAVQGHSIPWVDLELEEKEPPTLLYHGTARDTMKYIVRQGILPMGRNHVHLSASQDTAKQVGGRHGKPYVITVFANEAYNFGGQAFYLSKNGVWLTKEVPVKFLYIPDKQEFETFYHHPRPVSE
jgi:putative RNA 2'-phosphotransferase